MGLVDIINITLIAIFFILLALPIFHEIKGDFTRRKTTNENPVELDITFDCVSPTCPMERGKIRITTKANTSRHG